MRNAFVPFLSSLAVFSKSLSIALDKIRTCCAVNNDLAESRELNLMISFNVAKTSYLFVKLGFESPRVHSAITLLRKVAKPRKLCTTYPSGQDSSLLRSRCTISSDRLDFLLLESLTCLRMDLGSGAPLIGEDGVGELSKSLENATRLGVPDCGVAGVDGGAIGDDVKCCS